MDKDKLLSPRTGTPSGLPEDTVDVPGMGTVRVRGINRVEVLLLQKIEDMQTRERKMLAMAMLDPALAEHEAGQWQKVATAGEIEPVSTRIAQLSGMLPESAKEAYQDFEADPDAEFRALPGAEAVDDGGRPAADE
jgi:hypothetical protein